MVHVETRDGFAILRLEQGKVQALDTTLLGQLEAALETHREARAIVLTGTGTSFSAGVDLFRVVHGGAEYVEEVLNALSRVMLKVFAWPRPVVAALNGHAIGGGCILALACDHRVMADGRGRVGLPELEVGLPFPTSMLEICRSVIPAHELQTLIYSGATLSAAEALAVHIVDECVPADDVLPRALAFADRMAAIPPLAFARTKRALRQPTLDRVAAAAPQADPQTLLLWSSPDTLAMVRDYLSRRFR